MIIRVKEEARHEIKQRERGEEIEIRTEDKSKLNQGNKEF